jgi:hypothetical protein
MLTIGFLTRGLDLAIQAEPDPPLSSLYRGDLSDLNTTQRGSYWDLGETDMGS